MKKSSFPASGSLPTGAYLDYVYNGANFRISDSDFFNSLGVTGTISQLGAATAIPILDKQGSANRIRNIENGAGVKADLSPYNGVKLSHNFINGNGGVDLLASLTATQPIVRNLQAGSGIGISVDDNTNSLIVAVSGAEVSGKTVSVYSEADFPTPSAGAIVLEDDTDYVILNDVVTANRFIVGNTTTIRGATSLSITLEYTGNGVMFTGTNCNLKFQNINLKSSASGSIMFSLTGGGTGQLQLVECRVSDCDTLGTIDGMFITRFDRVGFGSIKTSGLTTTGSNGTLFIDGCYVVLLGGTFLALGSSTFNNVIISKVILINSSPGTTFLSGATNSANINADGLGTVIDCRTAGSATVLSGITRDDFRFEFVHNNSVPDSIYFAMCSMPSNATNSVISVATTPVLVAGTWVVEEEHKLTATTGGRVTYDVERGQDLAVTASASVVPASGGSVTIALYIAVNGTPITNSKRSGTASSGNPTSITVPWYVDLTAGDYVELYVANDSSTTDILVSSAVLRVG